MDWGELFSTAKDVYGDISTNDAARRQANALNDLAKAKANTPDLSVYVPWAIGAVVVIVILAFFLRSKH